MREVTVALAALGLLAGCAAGRPASRARAAPHDAAPPLERAAHADAAAAVMPHVSSAADRTGVPQELILAVIYVESRFRPDAISPVGAQGLMQLMPRTAEAIAGHLEITDYDPFDPAFNTLAGAWYLSHLLDRFEGDIHWALAAYNAGPSRAQRWRDAGSALPDGVRRYVAAVLAARMRLAEPDWNAAMTEDHDRTGLEALLRARALPP